MNLDFLLSICRSTSRIWNSQWSFLQQQGRELELPFADSRHAMAKLTIEVPNLRHAELKLIMEISIHDLAAENRPMKFQIHNVDVANG